MHDSAPNTAECFRCSLLVHEWWGILQVFTFNCVAPMALYMCSDLKTT